MMADIVQLLLYLGMMNTVLFTPSPLLMLKSGLLIMAKSDSRIWQFQKRSIPYHGWLQYFNFPLPSEFHKYIYSPMTLEFHNHLPPSCSDLPFLSQTILNYWQGSWIRPVWLQQKYFKINLFILYFKSAEEIIMTLANSTKKIIIKKTEKFYPYRCSTGKTYTNLTSP